MIKQLLALLLIGGLGGVFLLLWLDFTPPTELNEVARYYAEQSAPDLGTVNITTAIIVTYRGLDTLGEVTVLFLSAAVVGMVLVRGRRRTAATAAGLVSGGELLASGSRLLVPLIVLLGVYIFVNGHLTPGGGFQGGAILASAVLLMLLADPTRRFSHRLITLVESSTGLAYVLLGVVGIVVAGGFLDTRILPLGEFGTLFSAGAIPLIYSLIGLKVGAEFASMLANLSETEAL